MLGALGVVFGDIGTSPLYALAAVFSPLGRHLAITKANVSGVISLVIWAVTLVVSIKYVMFILRTDNKGEGGVMALISLVKGSARALDPERSLYCSGSWGPRCFLGIAPLPRLFRYCRR